MSNGQDDTVSVIDGATNTVIATIPVGDGINNPGGIGINPSTDTLYVANSDGTFSDASDDSISVIDGATNTVTGTIILGQSEAIGLLSDVGVAPVTGTIYATTADGNAAGTVWVIDGTTDTVTATIKVGSDPLGVAFDPAAHVIYISNDFSNQSR